MGKKEGDIGKNRQKLRGEVLLAGAVFLAALFFGLVWHLLHREPGAWAVVEVEGRETARYPLEEDCTIAIEGYDGGRNMLVIEDGCVHVTDASCPDKLCEKQGQISANGETIVCLPNRVVITVQGGEGEALDGLAE